jgi:hypothetical protein
MIKNTYTSFLFVTIISVLLSVGFSTNVLADSQNMGVKYWCSKSGTDWSNKQNWYNNSTCSSVSSVPTTTDEIVVVGPAAPVINLDSSWVNPRRINAKSVGVVFMSKNSSLMLANIIGKATFGGTSQNKGYIDGDAIFNDNTRNLSSVTGNAVFNGTSLNSGIVSGNAVFNMGKLNNPVFNLGIVNGTKTVNGDFTFTGKTIWIDNDSAWLGKRMWSFKNSSQNRGTILGDAAFYDSSQNRGIISGTIILHGVRSLSAVNIEPFGIINNAEFDEGAKNDASVRGNATYNLGKMNNPVIALYNSGGKTGSSVIVLGVVNGTRTVNGDFTFTQNNNWTGDDSLWLGKRTWTFKDSSQNKGVISGDATFYDLSSNTGKVLGTLVIHGARALSAVNRWGTINNVEFNDGAYNDSVVPGKAIFNKSKKDNPAFNQGIVEKKEDTNKLGGSNSASVFVAFESVIKSIVGFFKNLW